MEGGRKPAKQESKPAPEGVTKLKVVTGFNIINRELIKLKLIPSHLIVGNCESPNNNSHDEQVGSNLSEAIKESIYVLTNFFQKFQEVEEASKDDQSNKGSKAALEFMCQVKSLTTWKNEIRDNVDKI